VLLPARALDFLRPLRTSEPLEAVRALLPRIEGDQPLTAAIERVDALIAEGALERLWGFSVV
jgi:histidine ammonia-lyase